MDSELLRKPSILVVEDEQIVSLFVLELLEDAGFRVHPTSSGQSALRRIEQSEQLDAAIVDVGLPDMRGEELIGRIRDQRPHLPVVITTGYSPAHYEAHYRADLNVRVLGKPFDAPDLLTALDGLRVRP